MNYLNEIQDVRRLSQTGVRYMLRNLMGYSYKRASSINIRSQTPEKTRQFAEIFFIQEFLVDHGYNLILMDEFHADLSKKIWYNWSKRGVKAVLQKITQTYSINVSIAINKSEILLI